MIIWAFTKKKTDDNMVSYLLSNRLTTVLTFIIITLAVWGNIILRHAFSTFISLLKSIVLLLIFQNIYLN